MFVQKNDVPFALILSRPGDRQTTTKHPLTRRYIYIKFLEFIGVDKINAQQSVFDIGAKRVEKGTFHQ